MLKQISWTDYLSVIAIVLAAYYFIVIALLYRDEIRRVLAGKGRAFAQGESTSPDGNS